MRPITLIAVAAIALSTTAIPQVGQAPEERKLPSASASPDDTPSPKPTPTQTPSPDPGTPSTALVNSAAETPANRPADQPPPK